MKMKTVVPLVAVCALAGFAAGYFPPRLDPPEPEKVIEYVVDNSPVVRGMKISDALVGDLERRQKLIVLEAPLEEDIVIDDSFAGWEVFKKMQRITVKATGRFAVDLGAVSADDIIFDDYSKQIVIKLGRPEIDSVTINEEETVFHTVEKGLLRFGEIRLTSAEHNEIYSRAKSEMTTKLRLDIQSEAEEAAKSGVRDLADKFLSAAGVGGNEVVVVWN